MWGIFTEKTMQCQIKDRFTRSRLSIMESFPIHFHHFLLSTCIQLDLKPVALEEVISVTIAGQMMTMSGWLSMNLRVPHQSLDYKNYTKENMFLGRPSGPIKMHFSKKVSIKYSIMQLHLWAGKMVAVWLWCETKPKWTHQQYQYKISTKTS